MCVSASKQSRRFNNETLQVGFWHRKKDIYFMGTIQQMANSIDDKKTKTILVNREQIKQFGVQVNTAICRRETWELVSSQEGITNVDLDESSHFLQKNPIQHQK